MSKLNCRPGDLAIFVKSAAGNKGKIVRCVRLASKFEKIDCGLVDFEAVWVLEFPVPTLWGVMPFAYDDYLRPIRDQPGDDETLTWAGLPKYRESHVAVEAMAREVLETFEGVAA